MMFLTDNSRFCEPVFLLVEKGESVWYNEPDQSYLTEETTVKLDGFGLFVEDMPTMVRFYRDVLGFDITEGETAENVYLVKDGTLFMLYERKNFEKMTSRKYEYTKGFNGHFEIALYVDTFDEVDLEYERAIGKGAHSILEPTTEPWGQRTCYIADPEGNLIEIGSFNRPYCVE